MSTGEHTSEAPAVSAPDRLPRPSFVRRVRIRNYKSVGKCDVELHPLTLLVGRNGSGKSNFLDALVDRAVRNRSGWVPAGPTHDTVGEILSFAKRPSRLATPIRPR